MVTNQLPTNNSKSNLTTVRTNSTEFIGPSLRGSKKLSKRIIRWPTVVVYVLSKKWRTSARKQFLNSWKFDTMERIEAELEEYDTPNQINAQTSLHVVQKTFSELNFRYIPLFLSHSSLLKWLFYYFAALSLGLNFTHVFTLNVEKPQIKNISTKMDDINRNNSTTGRRCLIGQNFGG